MNHLIAKVRGLTGNSYRKLNSGFEIYQVTIEDSLPYAPEMLLEESQWYRIEAFSERDFCIPLLTDEWDSTGYMTLSSRELKNLEYLCSYQSNNEYHFQRVYKKNILIDKRVFSIGDSIQLDDSKNKLVLEEIPDAVYFRDRDYLYFRKLETIAPIFKGIDMLYREATNEETESFLSNEFIRLEDGFSSKGVGKANRRRIAMAMSMLQELEEEKKRKLLSYTNEYFPDLRFNGTSFSVRSDQDLKRLLYGIEQRMYTTEITNEKRAANSFIRI